MATNPLLAQSADRPASIYLFDASRVLRDFGVSIWLIQQTDFGTTIRASIGKVNLRIVIARPGETIVDLPIEKNSHLHIVQSIDGLSEWLTNLKPDRQSQPF